MVLLVWVVYLAALALAVKEDEPSAMCPDGGICPEGQTCGDVGDGRYACCPYSNAVPCGDKLHCCPQGHLCHLSTGTCVGDLGTLAMISGDLFKNASSKWVEVLREPSPSAEATVKCLRCIFASHGLPDVIVSDNGPAFTSAQSSNGAAERVVQTVKEKLKKSEPEDFECRIVRVLFTCRTTPHSLTGRAPAELLMGRRWKTALDSLRPDPRGKVQFRQLRRKVYSDRSARAEPVSRPGDAVWARNFRPGPRWVPAIAGATTSASSAMVQLIDGSAWNRHGDHLRHRMTEAELIDDESGQELPQFVGQQVEEADGAAPQVQMKLASDFQPGIPAKPGVSVSPEGNCRPEVPVAQQYPALWKSTRVRRAPQRYSP
ncbi:uncharacterized protein ISCGN_031066 [Ixodes scapularis]